MDENMLLKIMWVMFAQLGVQIDAVQDNQVINFSVPSISDYTAQTTGGLPLYGAGAAKGEPISGELLLQMANQFFEENGFTPNGRIRSEYWTQQMGEIASMKMQSEMDS